MSAVAALSRYGWELVIGFTFLGVYVGLVWWARVVYIARSNRAWTDAHLDEFRVSLRLADSRTPCTQARDAGGVLDQLQAAWGHPSPDGRPRTPRNHGSGEIGDWVVLHEAMRQAVWLLSDEQVRARFERVMGQLDELPLARRASWRQKYRDLTCNPATPCELRAALIELLSELHNARDAKYAQLNSLYAKALWLIAAALLPLAVLLVLGYGVVLIAGAIGGLISRLQRIVYAEGLPTAYGSSWAPLFCAPLLGALAAWAGLNLIALLQALDVVDLSGLLAGPGDLLTPPPGVVGVAVLLGISERLLNRVGGEAEKVLQAPDRPASPAEPPAGALDGSSPGLATTGTSRRTGNGVPAPAQAGATGRA